MSLDESFVVVTGAGAIGSAIVRTLLERGAEVEVWDVNRSALESLRGDMAGSRLSTAVVDITDEQVVAGATGDLLDRTPAVDGLVNTASILHLAPVAELSADDWRRTLEINLTGTFLCCRALLPALRESGRGSIVNISSIGGLAGEPQIAHYCASKFGVIGLTQSLAREEGPGVRVNAVCPGAVDSPMNDAIADMYASASGTNREAVLQDLAAQTPLGRLASPADVAATVAFLLSEDAAFITGESIAVTGGLRY